MKKLVKVCFENLKLAIGTIIVFQLIVLIPAIVIVMLFEGTFNPLRISSENLEGIIITSKILFAISFVFVWIYWIKELKDSLVD